MLFHVLALLVVLRPYLLIRAFLDSLFSEVLFCPPGDLRAHIADS